MEILFELKNQKDVLLFIVVWCWFKFVNIYILSWKIKKVVLGLDLCDVNLSFSTLDHTHTPMAYNFRLQTCKDPWVEG
jgi:hypothetical protein